jgi:hypothetical protein
MGVRMKLSLSSEPAFETLLAIAKVLPTEAESSAALSVLYKRAKSTDPTIASLYYLQVALLAVKIQYTLLDRKLSSKLAGEVLLLIEEAEKNSLDEEFGDKELMRFITTDERKMLSGVHKLFIYLKNRYPDKPDAFADIVSVVHIFYKGFVASAISPISFQTFATKVLNGEIAVTTSPGTNSSQCAMYRASHTSPDSLSLSRSI